MFLEHLKKNIGRQPEKKITKNKYRLKKSRTNTIQYGIKYQHQSY